MSKNTLKNLSTTLKNLNDTCNIMLQGDLQYCTNRACEACPVGKSLDRIQNKLEAAIAAYKETETTKLEAIIASRKPEEWE